MISLEHSIFAEQYTKSWSGDCGIDDTALSIIITNTFDVVCVKPNDIKRTTL